MTAVPTANTQSEQPETIHFRHYATVRAALLDKLLVVHRPVASPDLQSAIEAVEEAGPDYRSHRMAPISHVLAEHLSGPSVACADVRVAERVDGLLREGPRDGATDLAAALTRPLPLLVMLDLLDLPATDLPGVLRLFTLITDGQELAGADGRRQAARLAQRSLMSWVSRHAAASSSPVLADIHSVAEGMGAPDAAAYWCAMLLYAGSATTGTFLTNCLAWLLAHPDRAEQLRAEPVLLEGAVEELLRVEGPVRVEGRIARDDTAIGDLRVPRGSLVQLHLYEANQDPDRFPDPERVDFSRHPNPHLAFGFGVTRCLGIHLARLETREFLKAILPQLPEMMLVAEPEWGPSTVVRERPGLLVRLGRRSAHLPLVNGQA